MPISRAARCRRFTFAAFSAAALAACGVFVSSPAARAQDFLQPAETNAPLVSPQAPSSTNQSGGEIRAMWVVRDAMTSPQRIKNAVALAKKYRFNTLFVQVRGRGDAFYNSQYEPRSEELAGTPRDFDPLAVAVEEGHKAGLEVHAWMNTFLVWHKKRRPYSPLHVANQHPEWLVQDKQGKINWTEKDDIEGAFLDPAYPGARLHVKQVFLDVALRYPVDGIHFDYVRFPCERFSFSKYDLKAFREYLLPVANPQAAAYADLKAKNNRLAWAYVFPKEWKEWRQSLVTATVQSIADEAHRLRPNLIVSAAVFPNYDVAHEDKGQSWRDWLRDGFLDAACPMSYNKSTSLVAAQIRDAVENSYGRPIVAGVGAWQMPVGSAVEKGRAFRIIGAAGLNFFSYNGMTREGRTENYLAKVGAQLFPSAAPVPDWRRRTQAAQGEATFPATRNGGE